MTILDPEDRMVWNKCTKKKEQPSQIRRSSGIQIKHAEKLRAKRQMARNVKGRNWKN